MKEVATGLLLLIGAIFTLLAALGIVRMPDVFMRLQATSKAATLGVGCLLGAVAVHFDLLGITTRALAIIAFLCLTAPVGAHMIARAAYYLRVPPWEGTHTDELLAHRLDHPP